MGLQRKVKLVKGNGNEFDAKAGVTTECVV